jgi:cystathionine beta-synthase
MAAPKKNKHPQTKRINTQPSSILDLIGNTPILKLNKLTTGLQCTILTKLEFLNPSGSIKDRIGISMIQAAEA